MDTGSLRDCFHFCASSSSITASNAGGFFVASYDGMGTGGCVMSQRVFVLIHGAGMDASAFADLAPHLPGRVVTPVLPGHGGIDGGASGSIEAMAENLAHVLDEEPSFVLCGHSMGALVALALAAALPPPRLEGLVLMGAGVLMPVNAQLLQTAADDPDAAFAMILKWGVSKGADPALRERLAARRIKPAAGVLARDLAACDAWRGARVCAERVAAPVLVLAGAEDKMTPPAGGQDLAELFSKADFRILPGSGHMMMAERPAETAQAILDFLDKNRR